MGKAKKALKKFKAKGNLDSQIAQRRAKQRKRVQAEAKGKGERCGGRMHGRPALLRRLHPLGSRFMCRKHPAAHAVTGIARTAARWSGPPPPLPPPPPTCRGSISTLCICCSRQDRCGRRVWQRGRRRPGGAEEGFGGHEHRRFPVWRVSGRGGRRRRGARQRRIRIGRRRRGWVARGWLGCIVPTCSARRCRLEAVQSSAGGRRCQRLCAGTARGKGRPFVADGSCSSLAACSSGQRLGG